MATSLAHPVLRSAGTTPLTSWGRLYLACTVAAAAAGAGVAVLVGVDATRVDWARCAVLAGCAALAHHIVVHSPKRWHTRMDGGFNIAAVLLLPPALVVVVAVSSAGLAWLGPRQEPRKQLFNTSNIALASLVTAAAYHALGRWGLTAASGARFALGAAAVCVIYPVVNRTVLAGMLRLADGRTLRETGLFAPEVAAPVFGLTALGVILALVLRTDPWLVPFVLGPIVAIHGALAVPQLVEAAATDAKTRLYNAARFAETVDEEVVRAARLGRPLSAIMVDVDLLREINNTHGHLAGDAVLRGVADVIRAHVRDSDVAARFGGEEFAIVLPATWPAQAVSIAERIRAAVESGEFSADTSSVPVRATVSVGVACYPLDGEDAEALVHAADLALYRAKAEGRNRVGVAGAALAAAV